MKNILNRLSKLESQLGNLDGNLGQIVKGHIKTTFLDELKPSSVNFTGTLTCLCVDTIDPLKQGRVRFFSPLVHTTNRSIKSLPFAYPISSMGGFDDCGLNWVPPAGSSLCLIFENGNVEAPYYIGTTWHRDRGPEGERSWPIPMEEFEAIHEGNRDGYFVGEDDGSQVFPPWNTENYNGIDIDSIKDFEQDQDAQKKITYPNIYGFKTPQKHSLKMVDGDYKCNHKGKRIEILSSCGNWMLFKDDHLHDSGVWTHPDCTSGGSDIDCESDPSDCVSNNDDTSKYSNSYVKPKNECRPLKGPGTPQNNKCLLKQTGIQFLSASGHTLVMDDAVDEPDGIPKWQRSLDDFNFGCTDKFIGKMSFISATGHRFEMSDEEDDTKTRGEKNYIKLLSACGNRIELNDHSEGGDSPVAGEKRGITLESTSKHTIEMIDEGNDQGSPERMEGGIPVAKATKAYIKIRTGYGIEIKMDDDGTQEETDNQSFQIFCPQKDNTDRGPHLLRFQEKADGPGQVLLRTGGDFILSTNDSCVFSIGDKEKNPSDFITNSSKNSVHSSEETYVNQAKLQAIMAKQAILLMAGEDCSDPETGVAGPCVWPVLCLSPKGVTISDRVFVSASGDSGCASIFHLLPFHSCDPF